MHLDQLASDCGICCELLGFYIPTTYLFQCIPKINTCLKLFIVVAAGMAEAHTAVRWRPLQVKLPSDLVFFWEICGCGQKQILNTAMLWCDNEMHRYEKRQEEHEV